MSRIFVKILLKYRRGGYYPPEKFAVKSVKTLWGYIYMCAQLKEAFSIKSSEAFMRAQKKTRAQNLSTGFCGYLGA